MRVCRRRDRVCLRSLYFTPSALSSVVEKLYILPETHDEYKKNPASFLRGTAISSPVSPSFFARACFLVSSRSVSPRFCLTLPCSYSYALVLTRTAYSTSFAALTLKPLRPASYHLVPLRSPSFPPASLRVRFLSGTRARPQISELTAEPSPD